MTKRLFPHRMLKIKYWYILKSLLFIKGQISREHSIVGYAMKEIWSKMNDQKEKYSITQILKFANFKTVLQYNKICTVSLRGE